MSGIRVLHTADLHLDWLFESMPTLSKRRRRQELEDGFFRITGTAMEQGVDALLISGDLFHGPLVSDKSLAAVRRGLSELAAEGIETVLLPGNHDPSNLRPYAWELVMDGVHAFTSASWSCVHLKCGLEVWGRPWCGPKEEDFLLPVLEDTLSGFREKSGPRIVMFHGQALLSPGMTSPYMPFIPSQMACLDADYIALGHVHKAGEVRIPGTDLVARYPGSPFRLSFSEASPRTVTLLELDASRGSRIQEIEMEDRPYATASYNLSIRGIDEVMDMLKAMADPETCMQVNLSGLWEQGGKSPRELILSGLGNSYFHLEVTDRTEILLPHDLTGPDGTVRSAFIRRILDELDSPGITPERRAMLNAAIRLGLAALKGGVV